MQLVRGPEPVSSLANVANPGTESEAHEGRTPRPNPVPLDDLVSVTGAKAGNGTGSRDLFSEETSTVLVFKDGAVIRLAAPVSVGQLVFLTLKKTNQEVICQVLAKRDAKPGADYVELQFTEDRVDFWGVAFPENEKRDVQFKTPPPLQKKNVSATPAAARQVGEEDGDQLKVEVEALREKLLGPEKKKIEAARERETPAEEPRIANSGPLTELLAPVNDPVPVAPVVEPKPELLMPPAPARDKDKQETARAVVNMALPTEKKPAQEEVQEKSPAEDLLPEPELDFSKAPQAEMNGGDVTKIRMPLLGSKARVRGLSVVLVFVLVGAICYLKLWKYLPLPPTGKTTAVTSAAAPARPVAPRTVPPATANSKVAYPGNASAASAAEPNGSQVSGKDQQSDNGARPSEAVPQARAAGEDSLKKSTPRAEKRKEEDSAGADAAPAAPENIANDAPISPAKLLKPVNPVYPPDAMTNYITGDVKAEIEVDALGHVGEVKVISGPAALRDAAVAALKQYQYAPATQGGKPLGSKAIEVVKFWFNP